ncbi:hypothetical protein [Kiritimatiella glycovorans]|uniref:Adenosylcobalamin-dependent ribonucleoside-triphosphate reductase n=1 Tax=Kiritimatiella glycovorans TaxID=1307763 RepID=A0A0G3EI37_9BACT|nr:hypothetical protein [Kiritimatiella glycovorans]AKJ65102.1 Adenosylcobalamin-dependent ribonucleoside-triphosphate reductase [Kiritimatiella glycovorans]
MNPWRRQQSADAAPVERALQDYVLASRYARHDPQRRRRETFEEAVNRVRAMHLRRYPSAGGEIDWAFDRVLEKRCLPSMRSMQFGGEALERHHARMYNCAFSVCDRPSFFREALFLLLCGAGVGISVEYEHVSRLPALAKGPGGAPDRFTVPDSIEGWADALDRLVRARIEGRAVEFDYAQIRPRGEPLRVTGGRAPGPEPLRYALEQCDRILEGAAGRPLEPIECYDIMMHAADAVLAGGVRRSATICLFSPGDEAMMNAKRGDWIETHPHRARSNNSVKLLRGATSREQFMAIFSRVREWGEPGFYFAERPEYGTNPCCEIGLKAWTRTRDGRRGASGWQFCNLTEINGDKLHSEEDFRIAVRAAAIIGTCQAGYTDFPYVGCETGRLCREESLLGISITGMMDRPATALEPQLQQRMARYAVDVNRETAACLGIRPAARVTCVKPAGSTSLLLGTASGIHPRHARRYFRRIQANREDPVYAFFRERNPHMCENSVWSSRGTDEVITFCVEAPEDARVRSELSAVEFLDLVRATRRNWVVPGTARPDSSPGLMHNVSNTVTVEDHEWSAVASYIWEHREEFSGLTLLAASGDKQYPQAPHEEVRTEEDEARWREICEKFRPVDFTEMREEEDQTDLRAALPCGGDTCDVVSA